MVNDPTLGHYLFPMLLKCAARTPRENKHIELSPHKMMSGIEYQDLFNLPYGIDINPKDGGVWYAKLWADKIGHIDPDTLEITEYDTPLKGPRRPRFDADGILWIPSFDESAVLRFGPEDGVPSFIFLDPQGGMKDWMRVR